jgi:hypothetical protein
MDAHSAHVQHNLSIKPSILVGADQYPLFFPQQRRPLYRSSIGGSGLDEPERCPATVALMCAGPQMMPVIVALLTVKGARVYIDLTQNDMNDSL